MRPPIVIEALSKSFGRHVALREIDLEIPCGRVVGLLGRNGAGKTTLVGTICGLLLPSRGSCLTLGVEARELGAEQLACLGLVLQQPPLPPWVDAEGFLSYTAAFYPKWDKGRERHLLEILEVPPKRPLGELSPGDRQKVSLIAGVCHHPSLVLLDEPMSALDPIIRGRALAFLLECLREDDATIVISSHVLADLEKIIDWVVVLDNGSVVANESLDDLQERYAEWIVVGESDLPDPFGENFILRREGSGRQARLLVRTPHEPGVAFAARHAVTIASRPLSLDELFPLLIEKPTEAP